MNLSEVWSSVCSYRLSFHSADHSLVTRRSSCPSARANRCGIAAAAVTGGAAQIYGDGEIDFGAASNTEVKFASGYTGTIINFNDSEAIDLADIAPTATMSFSGGVLTINGGPGDVAHLHFSGSPSGFALTGDGGNGAILTDPPAASHAANASQIALLGSYMAAAFASAAGIGQASAATAESQQVAALHLTLPHA